MKQRWSVMLAVAVVAFLAGGWLLRGPRSAVTVHGDELLRTVLQFMGRDYVDSLSNDSLYSMAAAGAVQQLHDPYSTLEDSTDYSALNEITTGDYAGVGMRIDVRGGWITVVAPLPQTPAERAGLAAGDQIEAINGVSAQGMSDDAAQRALRGDAGTHVTLRVRRPGLAQSLTFSLVREKIHAKSIQPGVLLDDSIGYVHLNTVSESSASELRQEIDSLLKSGMHGLILDLRQNPGGLLDQGVSVSDLFLDPGRKIVETRGRMSGMNESYTDKAPQEWPSLPVVVLVDEFTASAAEIIAGALQDNDRAAVIGTATFGKGLVQTLWSFGSGKALKLTTGRWYTPSGRTIQRIAKNQEDQVEMATAEATRGDTHWLDSLPSYHTLSGRVVKGGGGIVPDEIVHPDSLTAGDRGLITAIGDGIPVFRDALVAVALDIKAKHGVTSPAFTVTPAMRNAVVDRLRAHHVNVTTDQANAGARWLDQQLSYEIERYVFGLPAELHRRTGDDAQVTAAVALLRAHQTPAQLLSAISHGPTIE